MVGHAGYGTYQALFNLSLIFQTLLDFGLQSYNTRTVAQSPAAMKKLFPNIIATKAILSFVYLFTVMVAGLLLGYQGFRLGLLFALCFVQVLNSLVLYLRSNVSAMHHFKADSILSVMDRLFMIGICSVLLFYRPLSTLFRIEWFVYAQIAAYLLTSVVAFIICYRLTKFDWQHYDFKKILIICKKSLPYATLIFLMAVYTRSDAFLLERMLVHSRPEEAGIYAAAFRLLDVVNNVTGVLFAGMLLPMFGGLLAKREPVQPLVNISFNIILPVGIATSAAAWFLGTDIMLHLYKGVSPYDGKVLGMLLCSFPFYCITNVYSPLLTADGRLGFLTRITLIAVCISLLLNFWLIPRYGAYGTAITSVITQAAVAIMNVYGSHKARFGLKADRGVFFRYVLFILLIITTGYLLQPVAMNLLLKLVIIGASAVAGIFAFGLISLKGLKVFISRG